MIYDCLIVGAGPSGGYLGYLLAGSGRSVAIVDKERFPREKTCGGGISQKTIELLDFDIAPAVQRRFIGAYLTYRNHSAITRDFGERGGAAVLRAEFDHLIVRHAQDQGAVFFPGRAFIGARQHDGIAEVDTSGGPLRARYLIGADGVFSQVRNSQFGKALVRYAPAIEALIRVPGEMPEELRNRVVFDFGGVRRGYGWIFPKRDHLNVGVYSIFPVNDLKRSLEEFIQCYRTLRSGSVLKVIGSCIPVKNTGNAFHRGNVWLVGDAAGFAESFYGEGIYFALKSAVLAARAMTGNPDRDAGEAYASLVRKELLPDLTYSAVNARVFFTFQKFGFSHMVRSNYVNRNFAELIGGRVGHRQCFYRTVLASPYWFLGPKIPVLEGVTL